MEYNTLRRCSKLKALVYDIRSEPDDGNIRSHIRVNRAWQGEIAMRNGVSMGEVDEDIHVMVIWQIGAPASKRVHCSACPRCVELITYRCRVHDPLYASFLSIVSSGTGWLSSERSNDVEVLPFGCCHHDSADDPTQLPRAITIKTVLKPFITVEIMKKMQK